MVPSDFTAKPLTAEEIAEMAARGNDGPKWLGPLLPHEVARLLATIAQRDAEIARLTPDAELGKKLEGIIVLRTHFTGDPPYVGNKGVILALDEALSERKHEGYDYIVQLRADVRRLREMLEEVIPVLDMASTEIGTELPGSLLYKRCDEVLERARVALSAALGGFILPLNPQRRET